MSASQQTTQPARYVPPPASSDPTRWPAAQIERAMELRAEGYTAASTAFAIATEFGVHRSAGAVSGMFKSLASKGVALAPPNRVAAAEAAQLRIRMERAAALSQRDCLHCRRGFASEGAGNRICSPCKALDTWR